MLTWMQDYWYLCLIAFVIGLATAAWIWLWVEPAVEVPEYSAPKIDANVAVPAVPITPIKPVVPDVKPVAFTAPAVAPVATPVVAGGPKIRAAVGAPDDLELIKGVGPKLNALLISLGVRRFDQIAAWTKQEVTEVDGHLGNFKGRIERDSWIEQAGLLASGNTKAFEAKFGSLGSEIKRG